MRAIIEKKSGRLVVFIVVLLLPMGIFCDTWFNNYENAKKAIDKGNWNQAVGLLRDALTGKDKPALKAKTYGLRFVEYLPYYYLGLAYYRLGRYKEAQAAFNQSVDHGVVDKKTKLYDSLQQMLGDCREKLKPPPPVQPKTPPTKPPVKKEQTEQEEQVEQVTPVVKEKDTVEKAVPGKAAVQTKPPVDIKKEEQKPNIVDTGKTAVDKLLEQGRGLYRAGKLQEAKAKFSAVLQLQAGHGAALKGLKDIEYAVGIQDLNQGIRRYFEGEGIESERYLRQALEGLSTDVKYRSRLLIVYQFLAVVLIEKYHLAAEPSQEFLDEAGQYIDKIKEIDPAFELEKKYFSPKVVKVFSAKR
jgi:tetratricopeptide (TPR) repeat protein